MHQGASFLFLYPMLQYFGVLPLKNSSLWRHSIRKMISASSRIFLHSFQTFLKKHDFRLQYFSCLPLKISSSEFHSIQKMISASRRIFSVILPICCPQYFSCLPLKISSSEFHSKLKMISASRRICFCNFTYLLSSVFQLFTPQNEQLWISCKTLWPKRPLRATKCRNLRFLVKAIYVYL